MAIRHFCGFETGLYYAESGYRSTSPTVFSVSTTTVKTGVYSLRCNYSSSANSDWMDFTSVNTAGSSADWTSINSARAWFKFEFRFASLPASAVTIAHCMDGSGPTLKTVLQLTSGGNLRLLQSDGSTVIATGSTVLSSGTWYRITWRPGTGSGASNGYNLNINGVSEVSGTNNNQGANNIGSFRIGRETSYSVALDYFVDDIIIEDGSTEPGDWGVVALRPNANGTYQNWTNPAYTSVDNYPPDTAQYWEDTAVGTNTSNTANLESAANESITTTIRAAAPYIVCQANQEIGGGGA